MSLTTLQCGHLAGEPGSQAWLKIITNPYMHYSVTVILLLAGSIKIKRRSMHFKIYWKTKYKYDMPFSLKFIPLIIDIGAARSDNRKNTPLNPVVKLSLLELNPKEDAWNYSRPSCTVINTARITGKYYYKTNYLYLKHSPTPVSCSAAQQWIK